MEREELISHGTGDRFCRYLEREAGLPPDEARARTRDLLGLLGGETIAGATGVVASFVRRWWLFLLRGLFAVLFGILALVQPLAALAALVLVFGAWAFIDGINAFALAIAGHRSWLMFVGGLIGVGVAVLTFSRPEITAFGLYLAIAAWSITRGILELAVAVELRKQIEGEAWLVLGGIASILFGVLMVVLPVAGVLALAWLIGIYALVFGVLMCALAFRLRSFAGREREPRPRVVTPTPSPA